MTAINLEHKHRGKGSKIVEQELCIRCFNSYGIAEQVLEHCNKNMRRKYCSSMIFFVTKPINDLLDGLNTPAAVQLKDLIYLHKEEELMKGFCGKKYARTRIQRFCGYYKYYNNNPQLFMKPANQLLREYVQRKKMILYRYIMSKEDSEQLKSTKNQQSSFRILDCINKKPSKMQCVVPSRKKMQPNRPRENSFVEISQLQQKLAKVLRIYEKKTKVGIDLPSGVGNIDVVFDSTLSQLSAIKPPSEDRANRIQDYGLAKWKQMNDKTKKSPPLRRTKKVYNEYYKMEKRKDQKRMEKANSLSKIPQLYNTKKLKRMQSCSKNKSHKRCVSTSSEASLKANQKNNHKYTVSHH